MIDAPPWSLKIGVAEAARGLELVLEADADARARIASTYGLEGVARFSGEVAFSPWLDGLRLRGRWSARVDYLCGVSMEPFASDLEDEIDLHLLPEGSRHAVAVDVDALADPEAPEPPETYQGQAIDVADLLCQHLAVALDPYPRKPGVEFVPPAEPAEPSPFAALTALKPRA